MYSLWFKVESVSSSIECTEINWKSHYRNLRRKPPVFPQYLLMVETLCSAGILQASPYFLGPVVGLS